MTPDDHDVPRARPRKQPVLWWMGGVIALIAISGAAGVIRAANARTANIERVVGLEGALASADTRNADSEDVTGNSVDLDRPVTYPAENYLLVGSDSREGFGADTDFIGSTADVTGQRSDTIMILHQERNGGASLMSVPRDLWVPIFGKDRSNRVNTAFSDGPLSLVKTVSDALGIPVHHYVEVDFHGFRDIIDDIGGVDLCVDNAAKDEHSGLWLDPGCNHLDGDKALAYARSRYYQEYRDESWHTDGRADLGRIERQQTFIRAAVGGALNKLAASPFGAGDTIEAVTNSVRIDDGLDPLRAAQVLRQAFQAGLRTFALPVYNDTVGDAAVLRLSDEADELLAYFRGEALPPTEFETSGITGGDVAPATVP